MTSIFWAQVVIAGVLVAFGGMQTVRLAHEKTVHAETRVAFSEHRTMAARAALKQNEDFAATASSWRAIQQENASAHRIFSDEILGQLALSRAAGDRLQLRADQLRAAAGQAPRDPGTQPAGPTASQAADLLAYMRRRLDEAAGGIGEFADRTSSAGELCVRDYDALSARPTARPPAPP